MIRLAPGRAWLASLLAASALAVAVPAAADDHANVAPPTDMDENVPGASALEGRIMAPCCWTQTIDIHGSEIANELRREIRQRLKAGESADSIQADLVKRYGERILAVPPGNPLKDVGVLLSLAFGLAGVGAGVMLVRWRRRSLAERANELDDEKPKKTAKRDEWDDQIDAELDEL